MDPDANVRERIALYRQTSEWSSADAHRMAELETAYAEWRAMGGYAADAGLLAELNNARGGCEACGKPRETDPDFCADCLAMMRDKRAEIESAPACTDLSLGATYPDGSRIPFVAGSIVRFHGAGVYVKTAEMPDAPVYINAWRHVDRERPFVIAGPIGAVPGMLERYRSANALTRDLRGAMVGWSEALADRIATLAPGQALTVPTLVGHATIAREV